MKHDHDAILRMLAQRARNGERCIPKVLSADSLWRCRYETLRKYRGGWPSVTKEILVDHPDLRPSQFLTRMPDSRWYLVELTGDIAHLELPVDKELDDDDLLKRFAAVLRAYLVKTGGEAGALRREKIKKTSIGRRIHSFLTQRCSMRHMEAPYSTIVELATGVSYSEVVGRRLGAKIWKPRHHDCHRSGEADVLVVHTGLQSPGEVALDDALALLINGYPGVHRHHVQLFNLVDTKFRRHSVDVVLYHQDLPVVAIELGVGGETLDRDYSRNRDIKRKELSRVGLPYASVIC